MAIYCLKALPPKIETLLIPRPGLVSSFRVLSIYKNLTLKNFDWFALTLEPIVKHCLNMQPPLLITYVP